MQLKSVVHVPQQSGVVTTRTGVQRDIVMVVHLQAFVVNMHNS